MATLDRWRSYLSVPRTIAFPHLELIGRDHQPPLLAGSGEVRILSLTWSEFTLTGTPENTYDLLVAIHDQQENPYDNLARFRLRGDDSEGMQWSLGWIDPSFNINADGSWTLRGHLDTLYPHDAGPTVSPERSTEVVYVLPLGHPMALAMARFVQTSQADGTTVREHLVEVLGSKIHFTYDPTLEALSITAPHSSELPPTYTENWLGEPLRILFGQLVFPRLVARNLGGGRTHVFVQSPPGFVREAEWAALWKGDAPATSEEFWGLYAQLLTFIALARNENGGPNFESNKVTTLYQEIIQAADGSRWVWALTFASSIEALVQMLIPKGEKRRDVDLAEIERLVAHINGWAGSASLKRDTTRAARRASQITIAYMLRKLVAAKVVTAEEFDAWDEIRNSVMHGSLVSPYSSQEEDRKLLALVSLVHALTREIVRRFLAAQQTPKH